MNTQQYQQRILELIKEQSTQQFSDEPYFDTLKTSIDLEVTRDISIWWRSLQIEKYCLITSNYLKLKGCFQETIKKFYQQTNVSPYIERAGHAFLDYLQNNEDALLAKIAYFERTVQKVKLGDMGTYTIHWTYEPYSLLHLIINGQALEMDDLKGNFQMMISHEIENQFRVIDLENEDESELA